VADTGIGIAPENLSTIFGAFQQGDGTLSRRYGGTGLGLSIAREVGTQLGGEITADSELGRGSTFTLYLPAELPGAIDDPDEAPSDAAYAESSDPDGQDRETPADRAVQMFPESADDAFTNGRRLLVLEGTRGGLLTLLAYSAVSDLAGMHGPVHVSTAETPEQALGVLGGASHQCVVLDLGLSDASAFTFLERVQDDQELRTVPVLAHTREKLGSAQGRLARLRFGAGRLELLPSLDELRERITLHLSAAQPEHVPPLINGGLDGENGASRDPGAAADGHEALRGKKVLVIDDDPRNVFAITSTLELAGVQVTQAPNGRKGIEALLAADWIDLIVMDVMMPELDGYATMTAIRDMPAFTRLPIIAVTARAMPGDKEKSIAAGASDYVTKPVDTEELLGRIEHWIL
jgi:CheY-like chemotaxis protein